MKGNTSAVGTKLGGSVPFKSMVAPDEGATDNIPKAYLTVLFFDERFQYVPGSSGAVRVSIANDIYANLPFAAVDPGNGYVYVYLSNESVEPLCQLQPIYFNSGTAGKIHFPNYTVFYLVLEPATG